MAQDTDLSALLAGLESGVKRLEALTDLYFVTLEKRRTAKAEAQRVTEKRAESIRALQEKIETLRDLVIKRFGYTH